MARKSIFKDSKVIDLYVKEKWNALQISKYLKTHPRRINRILKENNIEISKTERLLPYTEERKEKISKSHFKKGTPSHLKGKKYPLSNRIKNMSINTGLSEEEIMSYIIYENDYDKILFLSYAFTKIGSLKIKEDIINRKSFLISL